MMPQNAPQFTNFGEAVQFFYKFYSASAPDRFERYLTAAGGRHLDAVVLYRWNLELCEALLPSLHAAELTLKNAIHQAMVKHYVTQAKPHFPAGSLPDDWWYPHFQDGSRPDDWWFESEFEGQRFLKLQDLGKVKDVVAQLEKASKKVTTPRVVADLSFGFWVELLNSNYTESIVVPTLLTTMKNLPADKKTQGWLRDNFGKLRDLRNRVGHHEPIFQRNDLRDLRKMAWNTANEIQQFFVYPIHPMCRFKEVAAADLKAQAGALKGRLEKDWYEPYKKKEEAADA